MSDRVRRFHLLAYDIRDPRRLGRVYRFMCKRAIPVQYSVFIGHWNKRELTGTLAGLDEIIAAEDDVRAYPLPERCDAFTLGPPLFADGVLLTDAVPFAESTGLNGVTGSNVSDDVEGN